MKKDNQALILDSNAILKQLKDTMTIRQDTGDGYIELTFFSTLPGICLVLNDVHATIVPASGDMLMEDAFMINYCLDGRCEFRIGEDNYSYVNKNLTSIGKQRVQDFFYYPSAYYLGYEIYTFPSLFTAETRFILNQFSIDFGILTKRYEQSIPCATPEALSCLWNHLYQNQGQNNIGFVRLTTLQVLHYLCSHDTLPQSSNFFLTKTQSTLAKKAKELLTEDLSRHIAIRSIAASFGISETSLKNYFRSVYGTNISQYLKNARMQHAGRLLTETRMNISDIAKSCGYINQGRFAKVFRDFYGMKPLDYRRNAHLDS